MYIIGLDIGTTNCKVALINSRTKELVNLHRFVTSKLKKDDFTDFDLVEIWENVKTGIRKVCQGRVKNEIVGISITSVGEAGVLLSGENCQIGPCIAWYDRRGADYINNLYETGKASEVYKSIGIPPHSNYSVAKIMWLREMYPDAKKSGVKWLNVANYFAFLLTNQKTTEVSLASRTMAFDIVKNDWSDEILTSFQLDRSLFPPVYHSGDPIGFLTQEVAEELQLNINTPVAVAGHDHMVGSLSVNLATEKELLNSTGTTEGLLYVQQNSIVSEESFNRRLSNGIYVKEGLYSYFGSIPTAGYAIEWIRSILSMKDNDEFRIEIAKAFILYREGKFQESDLLFIPHLRGSGPPYRSIHSKGLLYGMTDKTSKTEIIFALFLGLCYELKSLYEAMQGVTRLPIPIVKVIGPAVHNPLWLQLKADILGLEVQAYDLQEPVATGAAIALARHVDSSNSEVMPNITNYYPDPNQTKHHQQKYETQYQYLTNMKKKVE